MGTSSRLSLLCDDDAADVVVVVALKLEQDSFAQSCYTQGEIDGSLTVEFTLQIGN